MSIQSGVEKTMKSVLNQINKATEIDPRKEGILKNINKTITFPIAEIITNENIRSNFDKNSEDFQKLVESIKQDGVLQSIIVEYRDRGNLFDLVCVAGHRRLEAAKEAGLEKISCLIQEFKETDKRTRIALAENLIREGMHPLDIADAFQDLIDLGWSKEKISQHYERDNVTIRRYLNISLWRDDIKQLVFKHKEIFNYSLIMKKYALKKVISNEQQDELKTEFLKLIENKDKIEVKKNPSNDIIINELREKISLKVEIKEKDDKGKLSIAFNNAEEKAKILNIFGVTT
jgi:ParB family transcriptional regulator, chromosome partitioning protein